MADLLTVTNTAASVVPVVERSIIARIKPHIKRALNAKRNLDDLKSQVEKLKNAKETVQGLVDEARDSQGREIHQHVENWLARKVEPWTRDDRFSEDDGNAKKRCFIGLCPNYIKRYQLSVRVEEGAEEVAELLGKATRYDAVEKISRRPRALATRVMSIRNYEATQSRTSIIKQIVDALASSGKNLIGLYGMGGVGKSTLVKVIAALGVEEELFDKVVIGTVTKNLDVEKIQEEIAESLGMKFQEKSERVRASRLHAKLKQEQKILVILDDLWGRIDLEAIGIPFPDQQKGLKILMTSRDEHVLSRQMGAEETFQLQVLDPDEAWDLFQKMVGDVKDPSVRSTAKQVAERCAGLPVLLATVARALRGADLNDWKDALNQLPRLKDNKFAEQVYHALELSYKSLGSDDTKSLFLLCGHLIPQWISLDYLLKCGRGLGLFESSRTLEEARTRLYKLVKDLKASCLLLDGHNERFARMHDIVHDFALLIASRDRPVFKETIGSELRWPSVDTLRRCTVISIIDCKISDFLVTLDCPKLELLILTSQNPSVQFSDNFFIRMNESLKVMDLTGFHFPKLPLSVQFLENLQTLCLELCILEDIHIIGELKKLKVLSFLGSDIEVLPKEIGQLIHLESLSLTNCRRLAMIPPDVLSCLTKLENLDMENVVLQWDVEEQSGRKNASLAELKRLQKLATLNVHITDAKMLPKGLFFEKLERFKIFIGEGWDWSGEYETSRTLKLKLNTSSPLAEGLKLLVSRSEDLYLQGAEGGVGDLLKVLEVQGSLQLKHLDIRNTLDIEFLANSTGMGQPHVIFSSLKTLLLYNLINLKGICHGQTVVRCFGNLTVLKVGSCDKLKYLISLSMARGLSLLEEIEVFSCKIMEKIVVQEGEDGADKDEQIKWNQLRSLTLQDLPQLESVCSELKGPSGQETNQMLSPTDGKSYDVHEDEAETTSQSPTRKACFPQLISFCSLSKTRNKELTTNSRTNDIVHGTLVPLTYRKVQIVFPNLEELKLSSLKMEKLCDSRLVDLSSSSKKLTSLIVRGCDNLRSLFTYSMVKSLGQLRKLEICDCQLLEEVIVTDEAFGKGDMGGEKLFPQLDFLKVKGLQQLVRFCLSNLFIFSSLKALWIESCPKLKAFVSSPAKTADMTANIETEGTDSTSTLFDQKVAFPELEELRIVHMDMLRKIWHDQLHGDSFGKLKTLKVEHASELQNVFPSKIESRLRCLENLLITDCDSLSELFDMSPTIVAQLKTLNIQGLPSLKSLFPVSIATMQLRLEEIEVTNCGVEEIITPREGIELGGVPEFQFPHLTYLQLWNLFELKGFYSRKHVSEWPMLKTLITDYDKVALFDWESQRSGEASHSEIQPFFSAQKVIPNLETLTINSKDLEIICRSQVSADLFCKVNHLIMRGVLDKPIVFPVGVLQRYFYNLKSLYVVRSSFKEMASPDEQIVIGNQGTTFPQMRSLLLEGISNLKHFWKQDSQLDCLLKNLETLQVWQCSDLTNLSPLSSSFQTLTNLDVYNCHGLVNIFTPLMANCLVQLTEISIGECDMVREVVASEGDDTEDEIVFSKLKTLEFSCLPRLTSFCPGSRRIKFQSLVKVIVRQCPKMRTFSAGVTSTPKLQKVQLTEDENKTHWVGDLNATIQQFYDEPGQAVEQASQLDSETNQAENDNIFSPIEEVATEMNLELEAKSIAEITTEEQDAVPEITQLDSRYQVSDAPSNDKLHEQVVKSATKNLLTQQSSNSDSSQEDPTSAQSSSTPTNRESDIPMQLPEDDRSAPSSEHPPQEDVSAILIQQSKTILESSPTAAEHAPLMLPKTLDEAESSVVHHQSSGAREQNLQELEDLTTTQNVETGIPLEAQKDPQPIADCETPAQQGPMLSVERATGEKSEHQSNINQPVIKSASATKNLLTQQSSICDETTVAIAATAEPLLTKGTRVWGEEVIEAALSIDSEAEAPPHDGAVVESKPINSPGQSSSDFATTQADHDETLTLSRGLGSEDLSSLEHPCFASTQKSKLLMDWLNSKSKTRETAPTKADLEEAVKTIEDCLSHTVEELNERRAYDSIEAALEILAAPSTPKHLVTILKVTARMIATYKEKLPKAHSVMEAHQTSLDKYSTKHSTLSNGIVKQKAAMAGLLEEVNALIAEDQNVSKKIEELLAKQRRIRRRLALATEELEQMSNETESLIREDESAQREMKEVEDEYLDAYRLIVEAEGTFPRVRSALDQVKSFYNL